MNTPIFIKTYDLMAWMLPALAKFPKEQRFRLAARIEGSLFGFHDLILRAGRSRDKRQLLSDADLELEKLRLYLRLAQDTRCMSFQQYEHAARLVNEVGKLLGGWMKSIPATAAGTLTAESGEGPEPAGRRLEQ